MSRGTRVAVCRGLCLAAACCGVLAALPRAAGAAAASCRPPSAGAEWNRSAPAKLGLDAAALRDAIAFATAGGSGSAAVYRHGCLAATEPNAAATRNRTYESWSTAKAAVSLAAGRAMTLGLLSPDDRVGGLVPEADRMHGALTLRQLLEMSSGLHWNFFRDYSLNGSMNRVNDALTLPFDHKPGTYFEYAQSPVALVAEIVGRAARMDFQAFVQRQLFGPIGIERGSWRWAREAHGNTLGFMGLQMQPRDYARLAHLMLEGGVWRGRRVLSEDYVGAATTPSRANPSYGWFWWLNSGSRVVGPTIQSRAEFDGRLVQSAPRDMFSAIGLNDQLYMVIPSLDLVVTRSGGPAATGPGDPIGSGAFKHELLRRLMRAVTDARVPDPGPARPRVSLVAPDPNYGIQHSAKELDHVAAARNTPPLPPPGPRVARAVLIGDATVGTRFDVRVVLACPPAGRAACRGSAALTRSGRRIAPPEAFRIPRGEGVRVRFRLNRSPRRGKAVLRVRSAAPAGATTSTATVGLTP